MDHCLFVAMTEILFDNRAEVQDQEFEIYGISFPELAQPQDRARREVKAFFFPSALNPPNINRWKEHILMHRMYFQFDKKVDTLSSLTGVFIQYLARADVSRTRAGV